MQIYIDIEDYYELISFNFKLRGGQTFLIKNNKVKYDSRKYWLDKL
jgi:hypothetical protein